MRNLATCHSERSEESRSADRLLCAQTRGRFLASLGMTFRFSVKNPVRARNGVPLPFEKKVVGKA